jgi:hypothetical protein
MGFTSKQINVALYFSSTSYIIRVLTFVARGWVCALTAPWAQSALSYKVQSLEFYFYKWVYIFCLDSHNMQLARNIIAMAKTAQGDLRKNTTSKCVIGVQLNASCARRRRRLRCHLTRKRAALSRAHNSWSGYINMLSRDVVAVARLSMANEAAHLAIIYTFSFSLSRPFCGLKSNRGVSTKQSQYIRLVDVFLLSFLSVSYVLWR